MLYCKRKFKIASRHILVNSIVPEEFIKDLYPALPPAPKPSWPGKRGRKYKQKKIINVKRPRRNMCYWKLPRYSEVADTPPPSPPRFVFRPGVEKASGKDKGRNRPGMGKNKGHREVYQAWNEKGGEGS